MLLARVFRGFLGASFTLKIIALILFLASWQILSAETVILKNGNSLQGSILKKGQDFLFVDLGFEIIKVPANEVAEVKKEAELAKQGGGTEQATGSDGILAPSMKAGLSVKDDPEIIGEAVVQVRTPSGLGSGFLINPNGYLITNDHVVAGEHKITVTVYKRKQHELEKVQYGNVRIVATSPAMDLALLKIEGTQDKFNALAIGDFDSVRQGQQVFAFGSPLGLERSVSQGIVSVKNRVLGGEGLVYMQHTAQINPGNSGGPLLDQEGRVVGITNMKLVSSGVEGMAFAIPASLLKFFLLNRDAFAFDPRNPNAGFRYMPPPGSSGADKPAETREGSSHN